MPKPPIAYRIVRRWTTGDARAALEAHAKSGLSVAAFAAQEGLDAQRLYGWRRRFRDADDTHTTFVEVRTETLTGDLKVEVVLRCGRVLRVPAAIDGLVLRRLADALELEGPC